jgi:hypothetical protein
MGRPTGWSICFGKDIEDISTYMQLGGELKEYIGMLPC